MNTETEKSLSIEEIKEFEKLINKTLPKDLFDYYLENNGGYPAYSYLDTEDYILTIDGFIPIKYGNLTIEKLINDYKKMNVNLNNYIPFANDSGGNVYLIQLEEKNKGKIYLWEVNNDFKEDDLISVCDNFLQFLSFMTNDVEEEDDE
jgi:hypothetical protein